MGLTRAGVKLLLDEAARRPFRGSVVTLGRQHVYVTADEVRAMAAARRVPLSHVPEEHHREPELAACGFVSDDCLFGMLGFEKVVRVDYSDYEAPDEILDLNSPETPFALEQAFDVVLDFGTIEHVFDIAAAMRHCCRMVRSGGRVIHLTPSSNCVEHGFFSVSPTLFSDFYSVSGFQVDRVLLCRIPRNSHRGIWDVYDYFGSKSRFIPLGMLDGRIWYTFAVATAGVAHTPRVPQQQIYLETWRQSQETIDRGPPEAFSGEPPDSKAARMLKWVGGIPIVSKIAQQAIIAWRSLINSYRIRSKQLPYPFVGRF